LCVTGANVMTYLLTYLLNVAAADTADVTDDADSDLDMPDDLLDPSDDEDRKRDTSSIATADDKVRVKIQTAYIGLQNLLSPHLRHPSMRDS